MKEYIVMGEEDESLESILERDGIELVYRARHVPVVALRSEMGIEELSDLLPGYSVREARRYSIDQKKH